MLNQLVEHTGDPGLIADVALYRHLTYHQLQEKYIKGYELYDQELKGVRQRLVAARARTRIHEATVQLTSQNQLNSRHHWMGLLGLDVHSRTQTPPDPLDFTMDRDLGVQVYIPMPIPPPSGKGGTGKGQGEGDERARRRPSRTWRECPRPEKESWGKEGD